MDVFFCKDDCFDEIHIFTKKPKLVRGSFGGLGLLGKLKEAHAKALFGISLKRGECIEGHLEVDTE